MRDAVVASLALSANAFLARVMIGSTKTRVSFAFASVVVIFL
jgi:hypothetical protein